MGWEHPAGGVGGGRAVRMVKREKMELRVFCVLEEVFTS